MLILATEEEPPANRGVTALEVGGGLPPRAGERSTVTARIGGSGEGVEGTERGDSVTARLVLEGAVRAAARVTPGAAVVFPFPAREPGIVTGRVELDADALTEDNRRHFVAAVSPPPAVALTVPLPFLSEAVGVLEDAGRIRRSAPGGADVVLAPGAVGADAVRRGGGVVLFPPASVLELAAVNQRLSAAGIPWRLGAPAAGEARIAGGEEELAEALRAVRLRQVYRLEPQGTTSDTVLLRLGGGEPWAVAGVTPGGGRYVLLATPLTAEGGSIPTSEAMLPLLDRAIGAWAAGAADGAGLEPGDVVTLAAADSLVGPDATIAPVDEGAIHRFTDPGIYRAYRAGVISAAYAVNPSHAESALARADPGALAGLLPGRPVHVVTSGDWTDAVYVRRLGREISWPLILAALLLLLAESVIAAPGRGIGRSRAGGPVAGPEAVVGGSGRSSAREAV